MLFTKPPRFKPFFGIYGSLQKIRKKSLLPFWWHFLGSVEIFLRKYTFLITMEGFVTDWKNGRMVIKKNRYYHTTSRRKTEWWASYHELTLYSKKVKYGLIFLIFSKNGIFLTDEFIRGVF